ncbi:DUF222 domain-containing protein [Pseudonocardia sp. NPDC049154]|uniref:DUF222 domain-containing protein n=1 Tax=Pseudonocardia sp. NPDC049154 TaxID=3155501 RepID=UPI0034098597
MAAEKARRGLDRVVVDAVADLQRRGVFAERGYRSPTGALGDLLGWERFEARRRVVAAESVRARIGIDGTQLPARLPATAEAFAAGTAGLRHVEVIAKVLDSGAARRLSPEVWAGAERELAGKTGVYTPSELLAWGTQLVEVLDQDGAEPDDGPPPQVDELRLRRFRTKPGGSLIGRFDDATMSMRSPPRSTPAPRPVTRRTNAPPRNARPRRSPRCAAWYSSAADSPRPAAGARCSTS